MRNSSLATLVCLASIAASGAAAQAPEGREGLDPEVVALIEESVAGVHAEPRSEAAWSKLCMAFEANLLWPEAADCFKELARLDGESALWRYHKAVAHLEIGEIDEARSELEAALGLDPDLLPALERLGYLLLEQGDLDGARARFDHLVELAPYRAAGHVGIGEVELMRGRADDALGNLEAAVRLDPLSAVAHYQLGLAYRALGRQEEAERELAVGLGAERAFIPSPLADEVARYSVHVSALIERAGALLLEGDNEEAARVLEELVERSPESVTLLNDLAIAYMRLERFAESRSLLDRALSLDEQSFSTQLNLSAWSAHTNRPVDAVHHARAAVEIAPSVAATHLALARSLGDRRYLERSETPDEDRAEMLAEMQRAIDIGVDSPEAYLQLGRELWRGGSADGALATLGEALERWPDFWPADLMSAWILVRSQRFEQASEALERIRGTVPEHPDIAQLERMIAEAGGEG